MVYLPDPGRYMPDDLECPLDHPDAAHSRERSHENQLNGRHSPKEAAEVKGDPADGREQHLASEVFDIKGVFAYQCSCEGSDHK